MSAEAFHPPQVPDARGRPLDVIALRGLQVDCIVGVYQRERVATQPLRLDVALYLDTRAAAVNGRLGDTVHYGRLAGELRFLLESCRFELLESAADAVCRWLLAPPSGDAPRARLQAVCVRLTKPEALGALALPSLQVQRSVEEMQSGRHDAPFGSVDILHEGSGHGLYRLRVRPGGALVVHPAGDASGLVLGDGLLVQGTPGARGLAFHWPRRVAHRYDNPTSGEKSVLCVARPRWRLPEEGIPVPLWQGEVKGLGAGLRRVPGHQYYPPEETSPDDLTPVEPLK